MRDRPASIEWSSVVDTLRAFDEAAVCAPLAPLVESAWVADRGSDAQALFGQAASAAAAARAQTTGEDHQLVSEALRCLDVCRRGMRLHLTAQDKLVVLHWADLGCVDARQAFKAVGHGGLKNALEALRDPDGAPGAVAVWQDKGAAIKASRAAAAERRVEFTDVSRSVGIFGSVGLLAEAIRDRPEATFEQLAYEQALREELKDIANQTQALGDSGSSARSDELRARRTALLTYITSRAWRMHWDEIKECAGVSRRALSALPNSQHPPELLEAVLRDVDARCTAISDSGQVELPQFLEEAQTLAERHAASHEPSRAVASPPTTAPPRGTPIGEAVFDARDVDASDCRRAASRKRDEAPQDPQDRQSFAPPQPQTLRTPGRRLIAPPGAPSRGGVYGLWTDGSVSGRRSLLLLLLGALGRVAVPGRGRIGCGGASFGVCRPGPNSRGHDHPGTAASAAAVEPGWATEAGGLARHAPRSRTGPCVDRRWWCPGAGDPRSVRRPGGACRPVGLLPVSLVC